MHEILSQLKAGSLVLDLGCDQGSFARESTAAVVVRLDRNAPHRGDGTSFVRGDAGELPFAKGAFAAVIANHSLEHFENLDAALRELRYVLAPGGCLFVSVPDASTLTDKFYRWLAGGGGHVNAFTSAPALANTIERATGLPHVATRTLYSSLSFLNRRNSTGRAPRRLLLFGGGSEWSLLLYTWASRRLDRMFNLRTSIYGWAFYFGNIPVPIETAPMVNVCIRCGSGCPSAALEPPRFIRSAWLAKSVGFRLFRCPSCGATNFRGDAKARHTRGMAGDPRS